MPTLNKGQSAYSTNQLQSYNGGPFPEVLLTSIVVMVILLEVGDASI